MEAEQFIEEVQQNVLRNHAIQLSQRQALKAIRATLATLSEQLDNRIMLTSYLPPAFAPFLHQPRNDVDLTAEEFVARVAGRESVGVIEASYHVRGVLAALNRALPPAISTQLCQQLPEQLAALFGCNDFAGER